MVQSPNPRRLVIFGGKIKTSQRPTMIDPSGRKVTVGERRRKTPLTLLGIKSVGTQILSVIIVLYHLEQFYASTIYILANIFENKQHRKTVNY